MRVHSTICLMALKYLTQRLYMHFDPEVAYKYSAVRDEADRLWKESIDNHDDSTATAAAGAVFFIVNAADGVSAYHMILSEAFELNQCILQYVPSGLGRRCDSDAVVSSFSPLKQKSQLKIPASTTNQAGTYFYELNESF